MVAGMVMEKVGEASGSGRNEEYPATEGSNGGMLKRLGP